MVNFRFHLVSLTAIFLALAAGIAIGAGVVDRQTVDFLNDRLDAVERSYERTNDENDRLAGELREWERFRDEVGARPIEGRLAGQPTIVLAVRGTDEGVVDGVRDMLGAAGSPVDGTIWFSGKWALEGDGDEDGQDRAVTELTGVVNTATGVAPADARLAAIDRIVRGWVDGTAGDLVARLRDAAFFEFEPPAAAGDRTIDQVPTPGVVFVVVSAPDADVGAPDLAVPLVRSLALAGLPTIAAEPTPPARPAEPADASGDAPPPPPSLVATIRTDDDLASRISTVDNADDYRGRVACVLAVGDATRARFGHYGTRDGAQRLLPEPAA